jgi:hypothetical protein
VYLKCFRHSSVSVAKQTMNYKHYRENWRLSNTNHTTQSMMNSYAPEGLTVPATLTEECLKHLRYTNFVLRLTNSSSWSYAFFYTIVLIKAHTRIRLSYKYRNHYALNDITICSQGCYTMGFLHESYHPTTKSLHFEQNKTLSLLKTKIKTDWCYII